MSPIVKTKEIIKRLPDQKRHLDFIAALLSVPVLLTVLILNLSNLENKKNTSATLSPTPTPVNRVEAVSYTQKSAKTLPIAATNVTPSVSPTVSSSMCKPDIGPVSIASPEENASVTANPTCIDIAYAGDGYCAVVWSYKINTSNWSDYSNNSVCLYNLPQGTNTFYLKVKSLISGKEQLLQRSFIYSGAIQAVSPTPTLVVSSTPTPTTAN